MGWDGMGWDAHLPGIAVQSEEGHAVPVGRDHGSRDGTPSGWTSPHVAILTTLLTSPLT